MNQDTQQSTPEALLPNPSIHKATPDDALAVARFCQPVYAATYPNDKYGITADQFAPWIFETEDTLDYFREVMENRDDQRAYIARIDDKIVGTVSVTDKGDHYEPRCFYVSVDLHGQGVGRMLWDKAMEFCDKPLPVRVMVGETSDRTIAMYEQWGFVRRPDLGVHMIHFPEWPEGVENGYIYLEKPAAA